MKIEERYEKVMQWFMENMPNAQSELNYHNPFELLVAVILSAQCTDKRVNMVTPFLFRDFPTPKHLAETNEDEIFEYVKSISYPRNKAGHLVAMAKKLISDYSGEVPSEIDELMKLPGVGRKTANIIASVIFNKPAMAVDTHVFRVANRIGLTKNSKTPLETERELIKHIPEKLIPIAHHWLILHGRYVCRARSPKCVECGISDSCQTFAQKCEKM